MAAVVLTPAPLGTRRTGAAQQHRHMWLHKMNDAAPTKVDLPHKHFERAFTENLTASNKAYVPYSTTVPKLEAWEARVARRG